MALKVYNTLSGEKEEFKPLSGNRVRMFVCGPTVYDYSHIGHARTYAVYDMIAKYLRHKGYSVFYLMNITDVDDNIINRAKEAEDTPENVAEKFTQSFYGDMAALGVDAVNLYAKASEHVDELLGQVKTLLDKGIAYPANESIYFEVEKFDGFGKLSGQRMDMLRPGARVGVMDEKLNPEDFALWKAWKPGEPFWQSPWGKGRPGWHIEDTAISITYFGEQYDIHGGGRDLIFPHHEAEIAIAESITEKAPFVKYWLHTGFLNVRGEKMSKSLGNFITIREILKKYDPMVLRFFLAYTHYRSPIDYDWDFVDEAGRSYERIKNTVTKLKQLAAEKGDGPGSEDEAIAAEIRKAKKAFHTAMDDDFNTREAIAAMFELTNAANREMDSLSSGKLQELADLYEGLFIVLGISFPTGLSGGEFSKLADMVIQLRADARTRKDFETSDKIRDSLKDIGVELEDKEGKTLWKLQK
jgi:cysteinyl-tRNA synthetase